LSFANSEAFQTKNAEYLKIRVDQEGCPSRKQYFIPDSPRTD